MFAYLSVSYQAECKRSELKLSNESCILCPYMGQCDGSKILKCMSPFVSVGTQCLCQGVGQKLVSECQDQRNCNSPTRPSCYMMNQTSTECLPHVDQCFDCFVEDDDISQCAKILDSKNVVQYLRCREKTVCQKNFDITKYCRECLPGFDLSKFCKVCKPGYTLFQGQCIKCEAGFGINLSNGQCKQCATAQEIVDNYCRDCTGNFQVDPTSRLCSLCKQGWMGTGCNTCAAGYVDVTINVIQYCIKCDPNTGLYPNEITCKQCKMGETVKNGFCVACPTNYTSSVENNFVCVCKPNHDSNKKCSTCINQYDPVQSCTVCKPGFDIAQQCSKCKANFSTSDVNCRTCEVGFKFIADLDRCIKCDPGYGWSDQIKSCQVCKDNQENKGNLCQDCTNNHAVFNFTCSICFPNYNLSDNCSSCNDQFNLATRCSTCKQNFDITKGCKQCIGGYLLDQNCLTCGPNFNPDCATCVNKNFTLVAGKCVVCKANQLIDETGKCVDCPSPLKQLAELENGVLVCKDCPGKLVLNLDTYTCTACTTGTSKDPATQCNTCLPGFSPVGEICKQCNVGFGLNAAGSCVPCTGNSQNVNNTCMTCNKNWVIGASKTCDKCSNNFDIAFNCLVCKDNYTLASECKQCAANHTGPTCNTCKANYSVAANCTQCTLHHSLTSGCAQCDKNWDPAGDCVSCVGNFSKAENCLNCLPGYSLFGERCIKCDPKDKNPMGFDVVSGTCKLCEPFQTVVDNVCKICEVNKTFNPDDNYQCTKCQPNFDIKTACSNCSKGYTYVNSIKSCKNCPTLHTGLTAEGSCLECSGTQEAIDNKCVDCKFSKTDGFWIIGSNSLCSQCKDNFTLESQCKQCQSGYFMFDVNGETRCIMCAQGSGFNKVTNQCERCNITAQAVNMVCTACELNYEVGKDYTCSVCKTGFDVNSLCRTCQSGFTFFNISHCVKCNSTHGLTDISNGQCVSCGEQEVVNNTCTPCNAAVHLIYNPQSNTCDACMVNYTFSKPGGSRLCTCNENFNKECNACIDSTYIYYRGQCSFCNPGSAWVDGECKDCGPRQEPQQIEGSKNQKCVDCLGNIILDQNKRCLACEPGYDFLTQCSNCLSGYEKINESLCLKCDNHFGVEGGKCAECNGSAESFNNFCKACPKNYILDANLKCTLCEFGFDLRNDCLQCKEHYDSLVNCKKCEGNYELSQDCKVCKSGYEITTGCKTCSVPGRDPQKNCEENSCINNFDPKKKCVVCLDGFVETNKGNQCLQCGVRGYINQEKEECVICQGLTEVSPSGVGCSKCPDGKFQISDVSGRCECQPNFDPITTCSVCSAGFTLQVDQCLKCDKLNEGFIDANSKVCVLCPINHKVVDNRCTSCPHNQKDADNGSRCTVCVNGFAEHPKCDQCAPNFVTPSDTKAECSACAPGFMLTQGGKSCAKCGIGQVVNITTGKCDSCGVNEEVIDNVCTSCDLKSGNWVIGDDKTCSQCKLGWDIKSDCNGCKLHFDCAGEGNGTDNVIGFPCEAGFSYVVIPGKESTCVQCPVGQGIVDGLCEICNLTAQNVNNYCTACEHGLITGPESLLCDTCPIGQEQFKGECIDVVVNKSKSNNMWILIVVAIVVALLLVIAFAVFFAIRKKKAAAARALAAEMARPDAAHGAMLEGDEGGEGPDLMHYTNNSISLDKLASEGGDDMSDPYDEDPESGLESSGFDVSEGDEEDDDWMEEDDGTSDASGPSVEDI